MPTAYTDIYLRDSFADTGTVPVTGTLYTAPDIIPFGKATLPWTRISDSYGGPDIGQNVVEGEVNNIYVRGKNLSASDSSGTASLYYSRASLLLLPKDWTQIMTAAGAGSPPLVDANGSTRIAPNGLCVSNPPFLLLGLPLPPSGDHYCTIAVVNTPAHPITIPQSFATSAEFAAWVQNNPAVAWRNITVVPGQPTQLTRGFGFGSTNSAAAQFHFGIIGRNFAANTAVTAQCSDQQCPIQFAGTLPVPDSKGDQITGFDNTVPGNFNGTLLVTATSPGGPFPKGATLSITYGQHPDPSVALDMQVARSVRIVRDGGEPTTTLLIQLGQCTCVIRG